MIQGLQKQLLRAGLSTCIGFKAVQTSAALVRLEADGPDLSATGARLALFILFPF